MLRLLSVLLVIAFVLPSCSEDPNPTGPSDNTSSKNSFNADGIGYSNASFKGYHNDSTATANAEMDGSGVVKFSGKTNKTDETFTIIMITPTAGEDTYDVNATNGAIITLETTTGGVKKTYMSSAGTIIVTKWDKSSRCSGTFTGAFVAPPSAEIMTVTDGKFDLPMIK